MLELALGFLGPITPKKIIYGVIGIVVFILGTIFLYDKHKITVLENNQYQQAAKVIVENSKVETFEKINAAKINTAKANSKKEKNDDNKIPDSVGKHVIDFK